MFNSDFITLIGKSRFYYFIIRIALNNKLHDLNCPSKSYVHEGPVEISNNVGAISQPRSFRIP